MLKTTAIVCLSVILFSCGNTTEKTSSVAEKAVSEKIKSPLEIKVSYPVKLEKGKSYQAEVKLIAHRNLEVTEMNYSHPRAYRGTVPTSGKISQKLETDQNINNTIPFTVQENLKDGYLVISVSYLINDKSFTTSSSIRLFADEFLPKTNEITVKEEDGSQTTLIVYPQ